MLTEDKCAVLLPSALNIGRDELLCAVGLGEAGLAGIPAHFPGFWTPHLASMSRRQTFRKGFSFDSCRPTL